MMNRMLTAIHSSQLSVLSINIQVVIRINEQGDKVQVWLEKFVDDVTYESVTVERFNCLVKADDKEHWMSDVDASDYDAGAIYYVALTVYAPKGVAEELMQLVGRLSAVYGRVDDGEGSVELLGLGVPLKLLFEALGVVAHVEGFVQRCDVVDDDSVCLKVECHGDAVVFLKDTLLGAFPDIAYIAKGGYRIEQRHSITTI